MRVDERGREHEPRRVDDAMLVRVEPLADRGHHSVVDAHVDERIDPLHRIEHARAAHDEIRPRLLLRVERHHATSAAASARTPTGPPVSTS